MRASEQPRKARRDAWVRKYLPTFLTIGAYARDDMRDDLAQVVGAIPSDRHTRGLAISIAVAVLLPIAIATFASAAVQEFRVTALGLLALAAPSMVLFGILVPWATGERSLVSGFFKSVGVGIPGADISPAQLWSGRRFPTVTVALIAANVAIYCFIGERLIEERRANPSLWDEPLDGALSLADPSLWGIVSATFMHLSARHMLVNMLFLAVFGGALESRIGPGRFAMLYVVTMFSGWGAQLYAGGMLSAKSAAGASPAISGVMGACMVRLYCARVSMSIPLWGLPLPVGARIRLPVPVVLTFYCVMDIINRNAYDNVAHFSHLGGYYGGLVLAYAIGLFKEGLREHLRDRAMRRKEDADLYSRAEALDTALELDGDDVDVLLARARHRSRPEPTPEGAEDYVRFIELVVPHDRRRAAHVFAEYFKLYRLPLEASLQLSLTPQLAALHEREPAAQAIERLLLDASLPEALHAQALGYYAKLLVELGCQDVARDRYAELLERYPDHPTSSQARAFLEKPLA